MADHIMVVFTECRPGQDDEFNAWYTDRLVPDVLKIDGFAAVQRFKKAPSDPTEGHQYLAVWEIDGNLEAAQTALETGPRRYLSPSYDATRTVVRFYTAITDRIDAGG
jgi:hypothetical protein